MINGHLDIEAFDCLVPVPLYRRQYWKRGFNQTELLVEKLGRHFNKTIIVGNLKRIKRTRPQYCLNKPQRIKNMREAFSSTVPAVFEDKTILLVDDVYTTGATANECAKVLSRAGARAVEVLVLAHGS